MRITHLFKINYQNFFQKHQLKVNLYKYECSPKTEYVENVTCKLYKNSKGLQMMTGYVDIIKAVTYADVYFKQVHMASGRTIINLSFEYCSSYKNLPMFANMLFELIKQRSNMIHECPFHPQKRLGLENFQIDTFEVFLSVINLQMGNYNTTIDLRDKNGNQIIFINILSSLSRKRSGNTG